MSYFNKAQVYSLPTPAKKPNPQLRAIVMIQKQSKLLSFFIAFLVFCFFTLVAKPAFSEVSNESTGGGLAGGGGASVTGSTDNATKEDKTGEILGYLAGSVSVALGSWMVYTACHPAGEPMTCAAGATTLTGGLATLHQTSLNAENADANRGICGNTSASSGACGGGQSSRVTIPDPFGDGGGPLLVPNAVAQSPDFKKAMDSIKQAKERGFTFDRKTGEGKLKGKKVSVSPQGLAALGGRASDFSKVMDNFKKAEQKAAKIAEDLLKNSSSGDDSLAGGGDFGGGATTLYVDEVIDNNGGSGLGGGLKADGDRKPAQVAGLSKDFNGNKIGVSADDIFAMIQRRYTWVQTNQHGSNKYPLLEKIQP